MKRSSQALTACMLRKAHMFLLDHLQLSRISEGHQILKKFRKDTEDQPRNESSF